MTRHSSRRKIEKGDRVGIRNLFEEVGANGHLIKRVGNIFHIKLDNGEVVKKNRGDIKKCRKPNLLMT